MHIGYNYSKYSKKRRIVDEHGQPADLRGKKADKLKEWAVTVALPWPLPVFDDKERLGHDVIELVANKFPSLIEISEAKQEQLISFKKWLRMGNEESEWMKRTSDSPLEASVYYLFALHNYRMSSHDDAALFASLFLTSEHASADNPVTYSAWAILAHTTVFHLFQLSDEELLQQWRWHVLPFKMAIRFKPDEAILHFENAHTLYQVATRISRYLIRFHEDSRRCIIQTSVDNLREDALRGFEKALQLPTNNAADFLWLCYFFIAKIHAKKDMNENDKIVKVVDGFYEAACSLELNGYIYPAKISIKNQKNVEPVEVHYQAHSAVWKYITRCDSPSRYSLLKCLAYLRAMQSHGVCRCGNSSLFSVLPEMHYLLLKLTDQCARKESTNDLMCLVEDVIDRVDLIDELTSLCHKGFEVCIDRFPHMKAHFRLAEMSLQRNQTEKAYFHLIKGIFRRQKKKEDGNFMEGIIEITGTDIDRSGSFLFHVARNLRLTIQVAAMSKDHQSVASIVCTVLEMTRTNNVEYISLHDHSVVTWRAWRVFREIVKGERKTPTIKQDLYRVYQSVEKLSTINTPFICRLRHDVISFIGTIAGNLDHFVKEMCFTMETKKKQHRKRKNMVEGLALPQTASSANDMPQRSDLSSSLNGQLDDNSAAKLMKLFAMSF